MIGGHIWAGMSQTCIRASGQVCDMPLHGQVSDLPLL